MDETEMLKLFYTMHFSDGTVKKAKKISNNSLYLEMFNEPDLVFTYESNDEWTLETASRFIKMLTNIHKIEIYEAMLRGGK
jgi:hypothetical protein